MKNIAFLIILFLLTVTVTAQNKTAKQENAIDKALKEIKDFTTNERKRDSISGHVLGSRGEEDYLRRYKFYKSIDSALQRVDKTKLSFDDDINLELLQYDVEDEVATYTFK